MIDRVAGGWCPDDGRMAERLPVPACLLPLQNHWHHGDLGEWEAHQDADIRKDTPAILV